MSDLPAPITTHSLSAPPASIRSSRYSATAQGRSARSRSVLPSGSSSLENASGWMRLPRPAAGMMPHIIAPLFGLLLSQTVKLFGEAGGLLMRPLHDGGV